ncbi:cell division protein ZapA [Flavimarina sp. Hel_I_48]|uniref:cell division protein ZapA n=1 Tax=Flavimarina sp. Hel_I_48 TaxID=1392488 RepID=UPI0004DF893D|nr:cell division protein ZapA [Flavimarina sp. Hel_I_48]
MADMLKIKVSIADRVYPLNINPAQEEGLRKAAKEIEVMIKKFEQSYAVRDKQDVLAMCALQFASKALKQDMADAQDHEQAIKQLEYLELMLSEQLS